MTTATSASASASASSCIGSSSRIENRSPVLSPDNSIDDCADLGLPDSDGKLRSASVDSVDSYALSRNNITNVPPPPPPPPLVEKLPQINSANKENENDLPLDAAFPPAPPIGNQSRERSSPVTLLTKEKKFSPTKEKEKFAYSQASMKLKKEYKLLLKTFCDAVIEGLRGLVVLESS